MGREKPLNVKMPSLSWPLTLPVRSLPAMRYNWGQRQQSITNTRTHRNWVRQSLCTFCVLIVIKFKCKYMYMFNKVLWTKSRLYAKIWKLFVYYPLIIKLLLWFFFSLLLEDLEAAERITISRKFKDDVVRPILKVGIVQVNVKRYEGLQWNNYVSVRNLLNLGPFFRRGHSDVMNFWEESTRLCTSCHFLGQSWAN